MRRLLSNAGQFVRSQAGWSNQQHLGALPPSTQGTWKAWKHKAVFVQCTLNRVTERRERRKSQKEEVQASFLHRGISCEMGICLTTIKEIEREEERGTLGARRVSA